MIDNSIDAYLVEYLMGQPNASAGELVSVIRTVDPLSSQEAVNSMAQGALQRANGLGPLAQFLVDPSITEIMVNGPGPVWLEQNGQIAKTEIVLDYRELRLIIERILDPLGLRIDRSSPIVDARLADGSRVNVVVPPLAIDGPVLTIRRFSVKPIPLSQFGPPSLIAVLEKLIAHQASVVVVGGTGSGKTTLLNALAELLPVDERIVTVEDTAELRLPGDHIVRLEARPANSEGVGEVAIRDLVRNALRMRPDRIVVGEVRGGEALDLLMALNTGHVGSLATCHANSPLDGLRRLETLSLMAGVDLPLAAIRSQLTAAVDYVVHVGREGSNRFVTEVVEVVDGDELSVKPVWAKPVRIKPNLLAEGQV